MNDAADNGLAALEKINDALTECREQGKQPACILCRPTFYDRLMWESGNLSTETVRIGVQERGGAKTVFGVRLAVTNDVADEVRLFEVMVA